MNSAYSTRSGRLAILIFALPLAALGFVVASWYGALAGLLVGGVVALRILARGTSMATVPTLIIAGPVADDTASFDAQRVAGLKREFDRAVFEEASAVRAPGSSYTD